MADRDDTDASPTSGWQLEDGEALSAAHPRSFFIPPREHREDIRAGESCGLSASFAPRTVDGERREAETVWVRVTAVTANGDYRGELEQACAALDELRAGDVVDFEPRHVVAIAYDPDQLGYDPGEWAIIDARILDEDEAPLALTFAEPADQDEGTGRHWFAALDQQPPEESRWAQLGELTDRWPQLADVFAAQGGMWRLGKSKGRYQQV